MQLGTSDSFRSSPFRSALLRLRSILNATPQAELGESMNAIEGLVRQNFAIARAAGANRKRGIRLIL